MFIFFTIAFFIVLLLRNITQKKWVAYTYIVSVYLLSLLGSLLMCISEPVIFSVITLFPSMLFCVLLWGTFSPFSQKEPILVVDNSDTFIKRFTTAGYVISLGLFIACLLLFTRVRDAFAYGLVDIREDMYKGVETFTGSTILEHIGHSALRWLGGLVYPLLLMFFYSIAYIPEKKLLKIMLFISSLSASYLGMLNGGRTKLIYWFLFAGFCLCLFYKKIPKKTKWPIAVVAVPIVYIIAQYFFLITEGRAENANREANLFIRDYLGQSYINFCSFINNLDYHPYSFRRIFPLTTSFFGPYFDLGQYRWLIANNSGGMNIGIFYTFMGDIFVDLGLFGLVLYIVLVFGVIGNKVCKKKTISFSQLLIICIFAEVIIHGVFYYSMYQRETSVGVILTLLLSKYLETKTNTKISEINN